MITRTTNHEAAQRTLENLANVINARFSGAPVARVTVDHVGEPPYIRAAAPVEHPGVLVEIRIEGERFWVEAYGPDQWAIWGRPFATRDTATVDEAVAAVATFVPPPDVYTSQPEAGT